jgi:HEAT repeat protein
MTLVGVFTTDTDLTIQLWDEALSRLTGISATDAVGRPLISVIPDLVDRGLLSRFHRALEIGSVEVLAPAFHHYLIPSSPLNSPSRFDKMQQRVSIAPLRDGDSIAGLLVTIEDVTERIDRELTLAEQLKQGDESSRLRAAEALVHDEALDPAPLLHSLKDESWKVRRIAVKGVAKRAAPEAIAALLKAVHENHQNPALLNSALQVLGSSDVDTLSPLLEFLAGPDPNLRMQAALALGEQRDPRTIPALIKALDDNDTNVRYHAIEALGKLQALEAVEPLVQVAESRDFFLAFPALEALTNIGDARIAPLVVRFLEDDLLREPAAVVLGQLGNDKAVGPLVRLLNVPNAATELIARALANLYDRYQSQYGEGEYIADLTRNEIAPTGFQNLIDTLARPNLHDLRPIALVLGWLKGGAVDRALTRLLGHAEVRDEIVEALVRHGTGTLKLLIEQLDAEDVEVRRAAVIALGRIGDATAIPALLRILEDESQAVDVAQALGQIGDNRALDGLIAIMGSPDSSIRQAAVSAVNSLASPSLRDRIIPLLHDADPNVRESAVKVAGYFGYPEVEEILLALCEDKDERVRCAAIEHLAYFDTGLVVGVVVQAFKEGSAKVRAAAARALANLGSSEAVPHLLNGLEDSDMWVRYFSTRSLARHSSADSIDALHRLLEREKLTPVRIAALDVLGQMGDLRSMEITARLSDSDDAALAAAAVTALGKIGDASAVPPLIQRLRSPHAGVRTAAANALGYRREASALQELQRVGATDVDRKTGEAAILALKQIASDDAIIALITLLTDPHRREVASTALSEVGDEQIESVARGLRHSSTRVRRETVEVLARMKRPKASEFLQIALTDPDPLVRSSAAHVLGQERD